MASRKISAEHRKALKKLGRKLRRIIIKDREYSSLDAFYLEFHDLIAKPTLYDLCAGRRDMRMSTFFGLCRALEIRPQDLLKDINLSYASTEPRDQVAPKKSDQ